MTLGGWINMALSVGFVTTLFVWCIWKVIAAPGPEPHVHAPTNIDPGDQVD
jgi:hypothetical protein